MTYSNKKFSLTNPSPSAVASPQIHANLSLSFFKPKNSSQQLFVSHRQKCTIRTLQTEATPEGPS
ncbi:hypothetical protein WH47_06967 [Habropoda laboriosa]|uniref:Uncharacterized protein n=1 Tax=Habropoda laboriosa TaxID=597456 RepID=A0A0L7RHH4_9HYME|nr:hypothetical protein WH47_06967 [Habropoda laboriosa]